MSTNSPDQDRVAGRLVTRGDFRCPWCGVDNDAAFGMENCSPDERPTPGCITVCWNCASVSVVTDEMHLRRPRPDENGEILDNPVATRLRAEILARRRADDET